MKIDQLKWSGSKWENVLKRKNKPVNPQVILVFGDRDLLVQSTYFTELKKMYPNANIVSSSTEVK